MSRFLSTLSLRRATLTARNTSLPLIFLSTLSLRRATTAFLLLSWGLPISIHALLAESDSPRTGRCQQSRISIHALLAESDKRCCIFYAISYRISIHALLAESDSLSAGIFRLFCISIHALLAESDCQSCNNHANNGISIHALLAESDYSLLFLITELSLFLSTLSLRRATPVRHQAPRKLWISIHALLAESDDKDLKCRDFQYDFYPRSPCGERHTPHKEKKHARHFYPRSPCGERLRCCFLSLPLLYFYPRSPCGERHAVIPRRLDFAKISIHALLAESDTVALPVSLYVTISIHALLAESDFFLYISLTVVVYFYPRSPCGERRWTKEEFARRFDFYPRSPCGERPEADCSNRSYERISIHALLAESDKMTVISLLIFEHFYPRSPCGERRLCY